MPAVNVDIEPKVLTWALSQAEEEKLGSKLEKHIAQWLNGTKRPTFNQIVDLSKKSNIPLGYFFLKTPPEEKIRLLEYRTIDSAILAEPSRDLIDTIHEMENVQEWMKNYRIDFGYGKLGYVGSLADEDNAVAIAVRIRYDLGLETEWYTHGKDSREVFNYLRSILQQNSIIVMMNGIVGSNTHRSLNAEEFRGFAIVDEWAPLIFINGADSLGARLFSLAHEAAHIWVGRDDLFNDQYGDGDVKKTNPVEVTCNAVAAELLVPKDEFIIQWKKLGADIEADTKIGNLSKYFHCGTSVIARRALDFGMIGRKVYGGIIQSAIDNYRELRMGKNNGGGDFYVTMRSRLDRGFVRALCESVNTGRTSYTEAYRLTNTNRKTFSKVAERSGGVEW